MLVWRNRSGLLAAAALAAPWVATAAPGRMDGSVCGVPAAQIARSTLSAAEEAETLEFEVPLKMRAMDELKARVAAGEMVPPSEMDAKYLPLQADYDNAVAWVASQGFEIVRTDPGRLAIFARGTVAQLEQAFAVRFARVHGLDRDYTSALDAPNLPAALANLVVGVNGLQPDLRPHRHIAFAQLVGDSLTSYSAPYTPAQLMGAYGGSGVAATGSGQTIAIVGETAPAMSDLATFWSRCGIPQSAANVATIQVGPGTPPASSTDAGMEATLDVEWASAIAPAAHIRVYETVDASSVYFDEAYQAVINDAAANPALREVSISYGSGEVSDSTYSEVMTLDQYMTRLASLGVSVLVSSGDGGSNPDPNTGSYSATAPKQVESPASDPNVTSVGGTTLNLSYYSGAVSSETAWKNSGGGTSVYFNRPSWQYGTGVPSGIARAVPDVASAGDPNTGGYVVWQGATYQIGGTSWSAPTWAGLCAIINQARLAGGMSTLGNLGPRIYPLLGTASFRDIVSGGNGAYQAGVGYDPCTGIGVPSIGALLQALAPGSPLASAAAVGPPSITSAPQSQTATAGSTVTLSVTATGSVQSYQWQLNGASIPGATGSSLTLTNVGTLQAGNYTVTVTDAYGSTVSPAATVTVAVNASLVNLSSRGYVSDATGPLIVGFGVGGTSGSKPMLFRGVGPTLANYGIASPLSQPELTLYTQAGTAIASAGAWGGSPALAALFQQVGAFALPSNSADSALSASLAPGLYTAQVSGIGGSSGVALAELYDASSTPLALPLINISSRDWVGTGANMLVAGFAIQGSSSETVLIRGIGPALASFGVSGILQYPKLVLYDSAGNILASNTGWGGGSTLATAFSKTGAFALPTTSADSALVITLPPGTYTAQVSGADGGTGQGLVEVYAVP